MFLKPALKLQCVVRMRVCVCVLTECDTNCVPANGCNTNGASNCDTGCNTGYYLDATNKCKGTLQRHEYTSLISYVLFKLREYLL